VPRRVEVGVRSILYHLAGCVVVQSLYLTPAETIVVPRPLTLASVYVTRRRGAPIRLMVAAGDLGVIERLAREKGATDLIIVGLDECPEGFFPWRPGSCKACARGEWVTRMSERSKIRY